MFLMAEVLRITTKIDTQDENYLTDLTTPLLRVSPGPIPSSFTGAHPVTRSRVWRRSKRPERVSDRLSELFKRVFLRLLQPTVIPRLVVRQGISTRDYALSDALLISRFKVIHILICLTPF